MIKAFDSQKKGSKIVIITTDYNQDGDREVTENFLTMRRAVEVWDMLGRIIFEVGVIDVLDAVRAEDVRREIYEGEFALSEQTRKSIQAIIETSGLK